MLSCYLANIKNIVVLRHFCNTEKKYTKYDAAIWQTQTTN